jgi:hypothetical protein
LPRRWKKKCVASWIIAPVAHVIALALAPVAVITAFVAVVKGNRQRPGIVQTDTHDTRRVHVPPDACEGVVLPDAVVDEAVSINSGFAPMVL